MSYWPQQIVHTIKEGENLQQIAEYFQTTAGSIIEQNYSIDPFNLQVGGKLKVCPGSMWGMKSEEPKISNCSECNSVVELDNQMRLAWEQHVYWTRMLIVSIVKRLPDQPEVTERISETAFDIACVFAKYYSKDIADMIQKLLAQHIAIGGAIITAARDGKAAEVEQLNKRWYANSDQMAEAFSCINPYYKKEDVRQMFYTHLDLTNHEVTTYIDGQYRCSIDLFEQIEKEAMEMADYFSCGIMKCFPQKFR